MRPSQLVLVALALEPRSPSGQTAACRRTPAAFTSVGGHLSGRKAGLWHQILRTGRNFFDGTGAHNGMGHLW